MKKEMVLMGVISLLFLVGCQPKNIMDNISQNGQNKSTVMTEEQARKIAEQTCIKGGEALGLGSYNPNSKTWWFDANLNSVREGCNPACVVSEETEKAEINWRCTGLKTEENMNDNFSLGNEQVDVAVREYLQSQEDFCWQTVEGSKKICLFEKLDSDELFPHYLWVRCGEFVKNGEEVEEKSGSSLPAEISYPNELSFFDIHQFAHRIPRDGSLYSEDIKNIFPVELQDKVLQYDATVINEKILATAKSELQ
ncbi:MAG TPA: hypothetical protein PLZ62_01210 [bacterium]|nr:hypothetical protein [bacterium]